MADEPLIVWERPERGARGPVPERSRAELTATAIRLADAGGLAAVSVRKVAGELGTGPASLYRYLTSRDDLLDLMVDHAVGQIDLTAPLSGDTVEDLTALASRAKAVYLRHLWLLDIPPEGLRLGPRGLDYFEHVLRALAPASHLPGQAKLEVIGVVNALVTMLARTEAQSRRSPTGRHQAQTAYLAQAARDGRHPHLAAALGGQFPAAPFEDPQALFERVVRRVLTALIGPHS